MEALNDQNVYVKALASLETKRVATPRLATGAAAGRLVDRIRRIVVGAQESHEAKPSWPTLTLLILCSAGLFAACEKTQLTSTELDDTALEQVLPAELAHTIASEDIEGTITFLHDLRESDHPDAFSVSKAAYRTATLEKLRKNLVYVFAHFNSLDADQFLISIAKTDISPAVGYSALRTFPLRKRPSNPISPYLYDYQKQFGNLYDYPELRSSQIAAVKQELVDVILDTGLDASVRSEALRVLGLDESAMDRAVIDEVVARFDDLRLSLTALELLESKSEAAARMAALYNPSLEQMSVRLIASRIGWLAVPEAVPYLLEFISYEEDNFDPIPFSSVGALGQLVRNLSSTDRLAIRPLVEAARSNYSSSDYRSERLQNVLDQIDDM